MNNDLKTASFDGGFSTLEILMAMAILVMVLSAVVLVSFGNQSMIIDSQTNNEAVSKAQELLESAQAAARKDYKLVNPLASVSDGIYQKKVDVQTQSDFVTKKVTSTVSWLAEGGRNLSVQLSALVTNFENVVGGDTCDSVLSGNWANPQISSYNFGADLLVPSDGVSNYPISGVDVYQKKMYVTVNNPAVNTNATFFIFDVSDPTQKPAYLGKVDNASVSAGLNGVRAAGGYAYVTNGYGANFSTCTQAANCSQLQIIDIANPGAPVVSFSQKLPGVTGNAGQAVGKSIFYKDGYVYLGLAKTLSGPEFNIIDVHNFPVQAPSWLGGYSVGSGINSIFVKGRYAYLGVDDASRELIILDVGNPANPVPVTGTISEPAGSFGYGNSLYLVGNKLYLGRTWTSDQELYIFDVANPNGAMSSLGNTEIGASVNGIFVRDYLAFLITTDGKFEIWRVDNPAVITSFVAPLLLPSASAGSSLDCEGNYFYAVSTDAASKGYLSIIVSS